MAVAGAYCKGACREGAYYKEAYCKKGGISSKVGISSRAGIGTSSGKDAFGPFRVPLSLYKALSVVYSRGVGK